MYVYEYKFGFVLLFFLLFRLRVKAPKSELCLRSMQKCSVIDSYTYIHIYICIYLVMYIYMYIFINTPIQVWQKL